MSSLSSEPSSAAQTPPSAAGARPVSGKRSGSWMRQGAVVLLLLVGVAVAGVFAWSMASDVQGTDAKLVFYTVKEGDLPITVTENGNLRSQKTTELRCEVENIGSQREGTAILSIVENGETVEEGSLLVELDAALIQDRLDEQELVTERARSSAIQANVKFENQQTQNETTLAEAELQVELAKLAVEQYEDAEGGTFQLDLQKIDLEIQKAEATRLIASTELSGIEKLKKLGYRSKGDLDQARLKSLQADTSVANSVASRKELVKYTYRKQKKTLEGAVASAERMLTQVKRDNSALLLQAEASKNEADRTLAKEEEKLAKYGTQLAKCKIYAPHSGMATYAIERDRRSYISEGAKVRERQRIITLPDLTAMEVKTGVHESVLDWINEGMPATVTVDAFPDKTYKGSVKSVAVLADPGEWHSSDVKVYSVIVTIDEPVTRLRPGMSTVVDIHVERVKDVLSVPVQAIIQEKNENWCYVDGGEGVELRKVTVGKTNDKFVEIREGLAQADRVVLNPMSLMDDNQAVEKEIGPALEEEPEAETEAEGDVVAAKP
ncbi:MAG: hypothetical protein CL681_03290 [Blastopirellula sp.]|nr:hypothetical protein [Blastopirellula sp.]